MEERTGYFGAYGGAFTPEILRTTLDELIVAFEEARKDPSFWEEFRTVMQSYSCRPTPITPLRNLSEALGGPRIFLKREDLNQTGSHKINNVMGQGLLVARMGKKRVIAETGAGQHGVATATMAARLGLECTIYMGAVDVERQRPNVFWMEQLGAKVVSVEDGSATLKDAINQCLRDWAFSMDDTHYVLGNRLRPAPVSPDRRVFPADHRAGMPRADARPTPAGCRTGCTAASAGAPTPPARSWAFSMTPRWSWWGSRPAAKDSTSGRHASRLASSDGSPGVAQGYKTYFLQDDEGQMRHTHSVAAGLDYIGVSPILACLRDSGRVRFEAATDDAVLEAFQTLLRREGIIAALESAHAVAGAIREAPSMGRDQTLLITLSGRGRQGHLHHRRGVERPRLAAVPATESRPCESPDLYRGPSRLAENPADDPRHRGLSVA